MAGFSVFQPCIGEALQFLPPLGTQQLDDMINAVFPGPASIQDKRANVTIDFFEYSQQTGQNFKFYPVPASFSAAAPSPASSAGLYDSAYGSSFNVSPVVSSMSPWPQSPATFSSSFAADEAKTKPRKSTASSSRQATTDFAHHPGMRIMTKDGRDVTNSASRGCKTKEQRDHAHLMRIIKACDACKRKKIRCDPSHKKRTASCSQPEPKTAKKAKKATESPPPPPSDPMADFFTSIPESFDQTSSFESSPETTDDLWSQFVLFDQEPLALADNFIPNDYDFFTDSQGFLTPSSSNSSSSPSQWFAPFTPAPLDSSTPVIASEVLSSGLESPGMISSDLLGEFSPQDLTVPYLNPGVAHGTDYVDFNLYSPPADFFLDEEPLPAKKARSSGRNGGLDAQHGVSPHDIVVASSGGSYSSPPSSAPSGHERQSVAARHLLGEPMYELVLSSQVGIGVHASGLVHDNHTSSLPVAPQSRERLRANCVQPETGGGRVGEQSVLPSQHVPDYQLGQTPSVAVSIVSLDSPPPSRVPALRRKLERHRDLTSTKPSSPLGSPSAVSSPAVLPSAPGLASSVHGRPLSVGQQLQTLSAHVPATNASLGQAVRPTLAEAVQRCRVLGEQSGSGVFSVDSGVTKASGLVATLPMQRLAEEGQKVGQTTALSPISLVGLVAIGLVSSLLAISLQIQLTRHQADLRALVNTFLLASIYCASLLRHASRTPETKPASKPLGTIDNVKTEIQAARRSIGTVQCAVSRRLEGFLPRLPALASVLL
ncbi:hypothetical protein QBC47DRAFT_374277 [Echria macrotheca]|uniref:Zn(2)-C6 fungal-type domain-containing protein n=1 Tax=Echria macrotheca TaxID=438768 RepID=A0AAJ0BHE6_9PEZI|nr:hypothetical protein QBC47DRAFT_374277 [Echria macrotheca]